MAETDGSEVRDFDHGTLAALRMVFDILIRKGAITRESAEAQLSHMRGQFVAQQMPEAAYVMSDLIRFVGDPDRQKAREEIDTLRRSPPEGSA